MKKIVIFAILFFFSATASFAQEYPKTFSKKGNVYLEAQKGEILQLTKIGKDRGPKLSPDKTKVVFLRKTKKRAHHPLDLPEFTDEMRTADEVFVYDLKDKKERVIFEGGMCDKINEEVPVHIFYWDFFAEFSSDSQKIYFLVPCAVTSSSVIEINIDGSGGRFVCHGNAVYVIKKGEYKDNLIVEKHKYFMVGAPGSYDWYWIVSPDGKEIGPLGERSRIPKEEMEYFYGVTLQ